jgi:hypothetical protein
MNYGAPDQEDLARTFPHLAPRATDAVVVAQLAAQSQQLLTDLTPVLARLLELVPGAGANMSLLDSVPQLRLKLYPVNPRRQWPQAEMPRILQAFAALVYHSQQLHTFPALKTQFWLDVLSSRMALAVTRDVQKSEFMRPSFPAFVVDFGVNTYVNSGPFVVDEALEDALVAFMTTSVAPPSQLPIGFVFRNCSLRVASLLALERFLARSFASATRQFTLRMLEVSHEHLLPPELEVLARIVDNCVHSYGVEELRLDQIVPESGCAVRADWVCPKVTPAPLLAIARTVFSIDTLPTSVSLASRPSAASLLPSSSLRRLSMSGNYFCLERFATRFSALRYGCPLVEDTTTYIARTDCDDRSYEHYWRWLAFGLFYPRPKRFASRLRLHDIGHIEHCPLSAKVFARTMQNPAAQLIFNGRRTMAATTELLVCVVKAGASVELFLTGNSTTPKWTDTLTTACELEAIYERVDDGAVCVIVPGVGLGWVRPEAIDRIEREPRYEQLGIFAGDLGWDSQWRADRGGMWDANSLGASMEAMVETVGPQFDALSFGYNTFPPGFLPVVLKHCTQLTQLSLFSQKVPRHGSDVLLDALSGPLGDRLKVLNLNCFGNTTNGFFERLFAILADIDDPPALRELRLGAKLLGPKQLEALHSVLQVNSTLALVELHTRSGFWGGESFNTRKKIQEISRRLNADFHGQLFRAALPAARKLAFLSVISRETECRGGRAIKALDTWLIGNIFAFADDSELRRSLVWKDAITPAQDIPQQVYFGGFGGFGGQ